ncbi:MAG: DUF4011 domain-containing protein, partial [Clostridiales Family XIII bacterium]|nr:DUF4011 domain-containing protein [Clostridiales Family XIII bacterium]
MDTQFKLFDIIEQTRDGITIKIEFQPLVNAALISSRFPFIRTITIFNNTNEILPELFLSAELAIGEQRVRVEQQLLGPIGSGGEALLDNPQRFAQFKGILSSGRERQAAILNIDLSVSGVEGSDRKIGPHLALAIEVSAANEFLNLPGMQQYIAAFVQPNTDQITTILRSASDLLNRKTSRGSIEGYQSGSARAEQIAGAIYEALRAFDLTYINPPASFEQTGQKVRTTEQVLTDHFGTCVDLSVTYAACLEAAGLSAVIFFTRTHAFPGFYRSEELGASTLIRDANTIANLIESGLILPLEMVGIGKGMGAMNFHKATQAGATYVRSLFSDLRAMVDIQRARLDRILPLSGREHTLPMTEAAITEARPFVSFSALRRLDAWKEKDETVTGRVDQTDDSPMRFRKWKRDLLDLSLRNPLLNMPSSKRVMDFIVPGGMLSEIDDMIHKGRRIKLTGGLDTEGLEAVFGKRSIDEIPAASVKMVFATRHELYSTLEPSKHVTQLRQMKRAAQTLEQETGSNYLFLTIGSLIHPKERGGECRAPLLLLPVKLSGIGGLLQFQIVADGDDLAQPNLCLLEWLRITKGLSLDALANPATDETGIAIKTVFTEIRSKLLEANLPFRVDESCSLAILKFSTFQIWRDLDTNWSALMRNPVVEHLVERPGETFFQRSEPVEDAMPAEEMREEGVEDES